MPHSLSDHGSDDTWFALGDGGSNAPKWASMISPEFDIRYNASIRPQSSSDYGSADLPSGGETPSPESSTIAGPSRSKGEQVSFADCTQDISQSRDEQFSDSENDVPASEMLLAKTQTHASRVYLQGRSVTRLQFLQTLRTDC